MPVATIVSLADEDDDSLNSQEHSQVSRYLPLLTTTMILRVTFLCRVYIHPMRIPDRALILVCKKQAR